MYKPYHKKRICPVCGTEFQPKNIRAVYCSSLCRGRAFVMNKTERLAESTDENEQISGLNASQTQIQSKTNAIQTGVANGKQTQNERKTDNETCSEHEVESFTDKELQTEREIYGDMEADEHSISTPTQSACTANAEQTENKRQANDYVTVKENANATLTSEEWGYAPEKSGFVNAISELVDARGYDERFINPLQYWPRQQAELVGKINKYVRCLLESSLKLSRYRNIPATDLLNLANAYTHVLHSQDFEKSGHPFSETLKILNKKIIRVYKNFRNNPKLRLVLSREEKVEIIAMLHEIGNTAPLHKFSELFHATVNKR